MYKKNKMFTNFSRMLPGMIFFIGSLSVYAQSADNKEVVSEQNVSAPAVEDEEASKNPFQPYVPLSEEAAIEEIDASGEGAPTDTSEDKFDYSSLRITGSVWGNDAPKAIINDEVLGVGDVVNEAKILNISKEGILFEFKEKQYLMKREGITDKINTRR